MSNRYTLLSCFLAFATTLSAQFNFSLYPTAVCRADVYVAVGNDCQVVITPAMIDAGSYTSIGTLSLAVTPSVLPLGTANVTLVASNGFGSRTCRTRVTVEDKTPPAVACLQQLTLSLDDPTTLPNYLYPGDVLVWQEDNCGIDYNFVTVSGMTYYGSTTYALTSVDNSGNENTCWGTVSVQSPHYSGGVCSAEGNTGFEYVQSVRFNSSTNDWTYNSGDNGGQVFFVRENRLRAGDALTLTYAPGFNSGNYREYWRFYLDLNRDGDWSDSGETIHEWNGYGGNSATVNLPAYFGRNGISRLRVVMSYGSYQGPCATGFYGEVEDYAVRLLPWWSSAKPAGGQFADKASENKPTDEFIVEVPLDQRVTPPARTALASKVEQEDIARVFPNPAVAGSTVRVDLGAGPQVQQLLLRSMVGSVISESPVAKGLTTSTFLLPANLKPGIYLLSGNGADGRAVWSRRVLVN